MRRLITFTIVLLTLLLSNIIIGQATESGDTLIIGPQNQDGTNIGALNYYIKADTTSSGERAHSVYKVLLNQTYILTATIDANFPLVLVADKASGSDKPPVIRAGLKEDGSTVEPLINTTDDWTMRNVLISGIAPTGDASITWRIMQNNGEYKTLDFEGCVFENVHAGWCFIAGYGATHTTYKVENCVIQNSLNQGGTWAGTFLGHGIADTVKFVNNTFFNMQGPLFTADEGKGILYVELNHNTFVNGVVHQFVFNTPVEAKVNNNIFYNCYSFSGGPEEVNKHQDLEIHGIIHTFKFDAHLLDSMWVSMYDPNGDGTLMESERAYELKNNVWYYSQEIQDYWTNNDTVFAQKWMNDTVQTKFFDNDAEYPLWVEENTMNVDPGFVNTGGSEAKLAQDLVSIREGTGGVLWNYETDGSLVQFEWPLPEDLSYSNASLINGGTDGFAVGDLNWFPGQKAQWLTDVEKDNSINTLPTNYKLSQNYPNPFNPSTVISFSIPEKTDVSLEVFNSIGQKVTTLVNKSMSAGNYKYNFDASQLTSGVYFYRLKTGNSFIQVKKMLLMK